MSNEPSRSGDEPSRMPPATGLVVATAALAVAWVLLVVLAVHLGRDARGSGTVGAWLLAALATAGAAALLTAVLVVGARAWSVARRPPVPPSPPRHRH